MVQNPKTQGWQWACHLILQPGPHLHTPSRQSRRPLHLTPGLPPRVCLRAYEQMRMRSSYLAPRGSEPPFHSCIVFRQTAAPTPASLACITLDLKGLSTALSPHLPCSFSRGRPALGPRPGEGLPTPASTLLVGAHSLQIAPPGRLS